MLLRTVVRDCLYLNWALPRVAAPDPPPGLRYELHGPREARVVLVSALLFRQTGLRWRGFPPLGLWHPQMNVRTYVLDGAGVPSVLFHAVMVPRWAAALAGAAAGLPCDSARFDYPRRLEEDGVAWRWAVRRGGDALAVEARPGVAGSLAGPSLGGWESTVNHLRRRDRGYLVTDRGLRRVETGHETVEVWPVAVEVHAASLVGACLPTEADWPDLHSAWVCPRFALEFEVAGPREAVLPRQLPAPG